MSSRSVHLVCSSGGVRCLSYVGAYKKLQEAGFAVESVSASSMGSVIGILICSGADANALEEMVLNTSVVTYLKKRSWLPLQQFLRFPFARHEHPDYHQMLLDMIGKDPLLGTLNIPFSTMAIDLRQRELLIYSSETHPEMQASEVLKIATAIPPAFAPYTPRGSSRLLVDSVVASESPAWLASFHAGNKPVLVLKSDRPGRETFRKGFGPFLHNMIAAAAACNDKLIIDNMPNAIPIEINVGDQRADEFGISREIREKLLLEGYSAMSDKLKQYNGDFTAALHVENIATRFTTGNSADRAGANARMMMDSYLSRSRNTNQVFISYSHRDRHWFDKFQAFFKPIEEFQNIKVWDDQEILPGQHWKQAIDEALMNTQVAFCIVTPNFLASDFILRNELSYFLEESAKKRITIFWVAASKSVVEHTPLAHIQCANDPASPLDMLSEPEQNLVITEICSKLIRAMLPAQA